MIQDEGWVYDFSVARTGVEYGVVSKEWFDRVNAMLLAHEAAQPKPLRTQLQERADYARDNAGRLFPSLTRRDDRWYDRDGDVVVFTPYGYRKEKEVENDLER